MTIDQKENLDSPFTEELVSATAREFGRIIGTELIRTVSPHDEMMDTRQPLPYLRCGASALKAIQVALSLSEHAKADKILDFGCGHGRVMRWMRAAYPQAEIIGTDVNDGGVNFCADVFGSVPIVSGYDFDNLPDYGPQDLIWSGSVFTHLKEETSRTLLKHFIEWLAPNGVAVFSTHGRSMETRLIEQRVDYMMGGTSTPILSGYYKSNYGFSPYLNSPEYGISLVSPDWYWKEINAHRDHRLVMYSERSWDYHHDIVAIQKISI